MKRWQTFSYDQLRAFLSTLDNAERNGASQFLCSGFEYNLECKGECPVYNKCVLNGVGVPPCWSLKEWKEWGQEEV